MYSSDMGQEPTGGHAASGPFHSLKLYIAGPTATSTRALVNVRKICEDHLHGRYELQVIDLSEDPQQARIDRVISLPTLLRLHPGPSKRIIGDMSNTERVIAGLILKE